MRFFRRAFSVLRFSFVLLGLAQVLPASADGPVVRAVLFFSPYCGHCQKVISEDLPPLLEKYGTRLQVIALDVTQPDGMALYDAAIQRFNIQDAGVPTLIVGDVVLIGSLDIPQQFPGLIDQQLARGGVDWPDIPGLTKVIAAAIPTPTAPTPNPTAVAKLPGLTTLDHRSLDWQDKLARDPAGNTLAIVVLMSMIFVVGRTVTIWFSARSVIKPLTAWQGWAIPLFALIGLGIASYLAFVETAQVTAVCGPVGDCNAVQQSEYARLLGLIPIGVLGVVGFLAILIAWTIYRISHGWIANLAMLTLFGITFAGTLFSIYLTFLEPFVIGATCAWCLSSAVAMTALLWLATAPGQRAVARLG